MMFTLFSLLLCLLLGAAPERSMAQNQNAYRPVTSSLLRHPINQSHKKSIGQHRHHRENRALEAADSEEKWHQLFIEDDNGKPYCMQAPERNATLKECDHASLHVSGDQLWTVDSNGYIHRKLYYPNKCLCSSKMQNEDAPENGTPIHNSECDYHFVPQRWTLQRSGERFKILSEWSSPSNQKCMVVQGDIKNGSPIIVHDCHDDSGNTTQFWRMMSDENSAGAGDSNESLPTQSLPLTVWVVIGGGLGMLLACVGGLVYFRSKKKGKQKKKTETVNANTFDSNNEEQQEHSRASSKYVESIVKQQVAVALANETGYPSICMSSFSVDTKPDDISTLGDSSYYHESREHMSRTSSKGGRSSLAVLEEAKASAIATQEKVGQAKIRLQELERDDQLIEAITAARNAQNKATQAEAQLKDLKREIEERRECILCNEKDKCFALNPCGHVLLCETCVLRVDNECPTCRTFIKSKVRVFY